MYSAAVDGNWSGMSIVSFWKVISYDVGSINSMVENICLCTFKTFKFVLSLEDYNVNVTGS